jgi:hypothetical protein
MYTAQLPRPLWELSGNLLAYGLSVCDLLGQHMPDDHEELSGDSRDRFRPADTDREAFAPLVRTAGRAVSSGASRRATKPW